MRFVSILFLSLGFFTSRGQDYEVSKISEDLLKDANAVFRIDEAKFTILSVDKAEYEVKAAITILNEKARGFGYIRMGYDKLRALSDIEINVYNKSGDRTKKVKSSDIQDRSANSSSFYDDNRIKWVNIESDTYPYTIEYSYKVKYKYLYSIPNWYFLARDDVSVEKSSFTLEYPESVGARYFEQNFEDGKRVESVDGDTRTIQWTMENLSVFEYEPYGPASTEIYPNLHLAPAKFSFEGYSGDLSTWDGMAKWQMALNEGRDELPETTIAKIKEMTTGLSRQEKIETVYKFVQENTRYVSIQLGIGGFQPFPAKVVDETGYGDCKALSFYTQSLLKAVGVDAYYTWVYGGNNPPKLNPEFPEDLFNHIILAVPHEQDTIWLECTSQTNPFGYLGDFTGDRDVLLINESGGHIVKTTTYPKSRNTQDLHAVVTIDKEGHAEVEHKLTSRGLKSDILLSLTTVSKRDQKEYLEKKFIRIPTFEILEFDVSRGQGDEGFMTSKLFVNKLLSKSGTRLFLQPNVMNKNQFIPDRNKERKQNIVVNSGYIERDTLEFKLPMGFRIEATFDPIEIDSDFGSYKAEIVVNEDNRFFYIREFSQNSGTFDKSKYEEYLNFHKDIVRADKRKIALISGT